MKALFEQNVFTNCRKVTLKHIKRFTCFTENKLSNIKKYEKFVEIFACSNNQILFDCLEKRSVNAKIRLKFFSSPLYKRWDGKIW